MDHSDFYREALVIDEDTEPVSVALPRAREMYGLIASQIRDLVGQTLESSVGGWEAVLEETLEEIDAPSLDAEIEETARNEKKEAMETLATGRFSVLKGSAGTGKTTVVWALLSGIQADAGRRRTLLLAPTGKARVQLERATDKEAQTIHQFLMQHDWIEGRPIASNRRTVRRSACTL